MIYTPLANRGMVVAPHHLAAQSGLAVLREGGSAVEAMVAAAATIAVVYPHMNSIGGDCFWLISEPSRNPVGIDACGAAAALATQDYYKEQGYDAIPFRGPLAALTVAGAVSGWRKALEITSHRAKGLPLARLLADAIGYARDGFPLPPSHCGMVTGKDSELRGVSGYAAHFLRDGLPKDGDVFSNPPLADTLHRLAEAGLHDFYKGDLARSVARDLEAAGSPIRLADIEAHEARVVTPITVRLPEGDVFNLPPPTQGVASLLILALYDRMRAGQADGFDHVHRVVESTKAAFDVRNRFAVDPSDAGGFAEKLTDDFIAAAARKIDVKRAAPWPTPQPDMGDTIWMGAIDKDGLAVSFIQSIYWEFGSGVVLPRTGVNWQNRGASFSLDPNSPNRLAPARKPFHTLNPALARFNDGRVMVYGTMGGDGQPQTQAAIFSRYGMHGQDLQAAVTAPRWLLGRTWGSASTSLKLESRFPEEVIAALSDAGHDVEVLESFTSTMGHAGAVVLDRIGVMRGAADPRSDGGVAAF